MIISSKQYVKLNTGILHFGKSFQYTLSKTHHQAEGFIIKYIT